MRNQADSRTYGWEVSSDSSRTRYAHSSRLSLPSLHAQRPCHRRALRYATTHGVESWRPVYRRNEVWYVRYKDGRGKWRSIASTAANKTDAKRLAGELEHKAERQRLGLEPLPDEDGGGTVAELLEWWLDTYVTSLKENRRLSGVVRRHFEGSELASMRLAETTPQKVEVFLQERSVIVKANTLNHLRGYLVTAFNRARQAGRWTGANPVLEVRRRKVPKRLPAFLRIEEVPRVLAVLSSRHRPLFATALYTGLRKGELAGLRKPDVDLGLGLINVCRSYDHDTTKSCPSGGDPDRR